MKINEDVGQSVGTRWLEGVILLVLLLILIFSSIGKGSLTTIINDQPVSAWSGTVDNLKE